LVNREELEVRIDTVRNVGVIESSLWMSMKNAGVDPNLALELSDIYAWTIDFYGLQKGDRFVAIYEKKFIDTNYIGLGKIIACRFENSGHSFYGYRFTQDSLEDVFDEEGGSLRRAFLKAPLRFKRISSGYSNSRLHPVLKIRRPHHGVDYAAATGTPIHTIGDGRVIFIGRKGGYGKRVEIKHNGVYTTGYAHMSRYAKGLKKGDFVKQGQTIGYVGMTGTATGPHLDFRVYKNGQPINPLKMKSPPAVPIKKEYLDDYKKVMDKYSPQLEF
jgi:murein DD-endopeptidase MepM/ murein hydrolase activator NlpD